MACKKANERKDHLVIINNILYTGIRSTGKINIPEGVTKICPYAFYYNDRVTSIVVPKSVKYCGTRCFGGCVSLKNITFKNRNTQLKLDDGMVQLYPENNSKNIATEWEEGAFYPGDYWNYELHAEVSKPISQTLIIKGYNNSTAQKMAKSLAKMPWGNQQIKFVNIKTNKMTIYGKPISLSLKKGSTSNKLKIDYKNRNEGIKKLHINRVVQKWQL